MSDFFLSEIAARAIKTKKIEPNDRIFDRYKLITSDRLCQSITALENRLDKDSMDRSVVKSYMWKVVNKPNGIEVIEVWLKIGRMLARIGEHDKKLQFSSEDALEWLKDIHSLVSSCEPDNGLGKYLHRLAIEQSWPKTPPIEEGMHNWKYDGILDKIVPDERTDDQIQHDMVMSL